MQQSFAIKTATADQFSDIGQLLVEVYSKLDGFPSRNEQPDYYELLANVGEFTRNPGVDILVALDGTKLLGTIVYFADLQYYGSGGTATEIKNASGFRLLAVGPAARGRGVGKALAQACIDKARRKQHSRVIIHTTEYMRAARSLYQRMGFKRFPEIDFMQEDLPVTGYCLDL